MIPRRRYLTPVLWILALWLAVWSFRQVPLDQMLGQLARLSGRDWLFWLLINIAILYIAVRRWQVLGHAVQARLSLLRLFALRQAGSAVSFLTPGPHFGGEPLQLYWLCRGDRLPLPQAVAVLGLDRFMETGTNLFVLLAAVLLLVGTALLPAGEWLQVTATLVALLAGVLLAALLLLHQPDWLAGRLRPLLRRRRGADGEDSGPGRAAAWWDDLRVRLRDALSKRGKAVGQALVWSLLGWVALFVELVVLLRYLGLSPSPSGVVLIMVGMRLAMLLPVPGGIGTVEASLLWSFRLLGLPVVAAAGLIALIRLRDALLLLVGLGCLAGINSLTRPAETAPVSSSR